MVAEVFADDKINDHRIAKDLYLSIGLPDSSKVFCTLKGGTGRLGEACHDVPVGASTFSLQVNDFDYCGVYFIFDALVSYTGNSHAGIARFRHEDMAYSLAGPSGNRCLIVTERKPEMVPTQEICVNFWGHAMNPRRNVYRYISAPLRLLISTPETVLMYGMLGLSVLNETIFKN